MKTRTRFGKMTQMTQIGRRLRLALFFILLLGAPTPASAGVEYSRSEDGILYFSGSAVLSLKADLYDVHLLGKLDAPEGGIPYFAVTAKPCSDCSRERGIFIVRPTAGFKPVSLTYPGKLIDTKAQGAVLDSRAFLGKCLRSKPGDVLIVFQKERIDRKNKPQASVFIAEPGADHLEETLLERRLPNFNDTLALVKRKVCREIDGRNRVIQKKTDIKTRFKREDEEESDDDDEKTSATPDAKES